VAGRFVIDKADDDGLFRVHDLIPDDAHRHSV
jgi:hypothetical protein